MADASGLTFNRPYRMFALRVFNCIGAGARWMGLRHPLSVDRILRTAERETGLHDFGSDDFLEPLRVLVDEFEHRADLHPFGRLVIASMLTQNAKNRLLLEDAWQRHADYLQHDLPKPLYVIGMPRTGTTLLYNLLCQDPHARPLMVWETMFPTLSRREEHRTDWRPGHTRLITIAANMLAPTLKQVHPFEPDTPEEDGWLLNNTFVSLMFLLNGDLPGYLAYVEAQPNERWMQVYGYYRRTLQLLQAGDTSRHWVLKSPVHQGTMGELLDAVPSANVVYTHRNPQEVIPSLCSLICTLRGMLSDGARAAQVGADVLSRMARTIELAQRAEERHRDRIHNVFFDSLMKDPIGAVRDIYQRLDYEFSPAMEVGMQRWLAENPQGKHGQHKYKPEQFGITTADIQHHFGGYWQRMQGQRDAA